MPGAPRRSPPEIIDIDDTDDEEEKQRLKVDFVQSVMDQLETENPFQTTTTLCQDVAEAIDWIMDRSSQQVDYLLAIYLHCVS